VAIVLGVGLIASNFGSGNDVPGVLGLVFLAGAFFFVFEISRLFRRR
jgi:hypothetical protein